MIKRKHPRGHVENHHRDEKGRQAARTPFEQLLVLILEGDEPTDAGADEGADAVSVGRSYLFGLGAGGEAGVDRALALLKEEIVRDMAILGCRTIDGITSDYVRRRP